MGVGDFSGLERRALCSCCLRPLSGNLIASRCNHVFHRSCLQGSGAARCRQCGTGDVREGALDLYGISFDEDDVALFAAAAARGRATQIVDLDPDDQPVSSNSEETLLEISKLRVQNGELRSALEKLRAQATATNCLAEKQEQKLADAKRVAAKQEQALQGAKADLEKCQQRRNTLMDQVQRGRERDAIIEYRDILNSTSPADALPFLNTTLSFHPEPAQLLTEVSRLRDYHRSQGALLHREAVSMSQRGKKLKRELGEKQQSVDILQRDLKKLMPPGTRYTSSQSSSTGDIGFEGNATSFSTALHRAPSSDLSEVQGQKRSHGDLQACSPDVAPSPLRRRRVVSEPSVETNPAAVVTHTFVALETSSGNESGAIANVTQASIACSLSVVETDPLSDMPAMPQVANPAENVSDGLVTG